MQLQDFVREVRIARNELRAIKEILRQEVGEEQLMACGEQAAPVEALHREDGLLILRVVFEPGSANGQRVTAAPRSAIEASSMHRLCVCGLPRFTIANTTKAPNRASSVKGMMRN